MNSGNNEIRMEFNSELILSCLYGRNVVQGVDLKPATERTGASTSSTQHLYSGTETSPPEHDKADNRLLTPTERQDTLPRQENAHAPLENTHQPPPTWDSYAYTSFPQEVQLCTSSIPGAVFGVRTTARIPRGTWIGPYEGKKIKPEDIKGVIDCNYMWEIFENDTLSFYIDGRDENSSSWMRFIRCARHKSEQNMVVFQYEGNIFYRAFRDISPEEELLVWYDESYPQYLGIPVGFMGKQFIRSATDQTQRLSSSSIPNEPSSSLHQAVSGEPCSSSHHTRPLTRQRSLDSQVNITSSTMSERRRPVRTSNVLESESPPKARKSSESSSTQSEQSSLPEEKHSFFEDEDILKISNQEGRSQGSPSCRYSPNEDISTWKCGQCEKTFTQRLTLQMHVCARLADKPYQCGHCQLSFTNPSYLRGHVVSHVNEKPFKCGFCARAFAGATTLNNHIRMHTGEKPFNCEKCGVTFAQAAHLARHSRIPGKCSPVSFTSTEIPEEKTSPL